MTTAPTGGEPSPQPPPPSESGRIADKHTFAKAFARSAPIVVDAPELGPDHAVRFKGEFTVDDVLAVVAVPGWDSQPLTLDLALARLALLGEDDRPLVEDGNDVWFQRGSNGVMIARLARRAGLADRFLCAFRGQPDGDDAEPLDEDRLRRTIAELAVVLRLAPSGIRSWAARDLVDVLSTLRERSDRES